VNARFISCFKPVVEEEGLEDLDVAETLLLQEFQHLPLVAVLGYDLFDCF
jgi:hypothetical protein